MTVAICLNCGGFKFGAFLSCPRCEAESLDDDISILLSDHNLTPIELRRISRVVRRIHHTGLDQEVRFHALLYFLSRKWPKLLEFDMDAVDPELQVALDSVYRSQLADMCGQENPRLKVPPVTARRWTAASISELQVQEDEWQEEVRDVLAGGMGIARRVVSLKIQAGEGAVLQKLTHRLRSVIHPWDYDRLASNAIEIEGDVKEYRRRVDAFCSKVKNGWSGRTKEQAAYFRGLCQRLVEMTENTRAIIEHKTGAHILIPMDFERVRQEFSKNYRTFVNLVRVVADPSRINPDGTCRAD